MNNPRASPARLRVFAVEGCATRQAHRAMLGTGRYLDGFRFPEREGVEGST